MHQQPLVLRQGGGSDLGVIGLSQNEVSEGLTRTWELHGSPHHWTNEEVIGFLTKTNGRTLKSFKQDQTWSSFFLDFQSQSCACTTRRRMARERRGAGSSLVSMETPYYKQYIKDVL